MTLAFFALAYWGLVIRNSMRRTHEQLGAQHWERIALSRQSLDVWLSLMLGAFLLVEVLLESVTAFAIAVSILLAACLLVISMRSRRTQNAPGSPTPTERTGGVRYWVFLHAVAMIAFTGGWIALLVVAHNSKQPTRPPLSSCSRPSVTSIPGVSGSIVVGVCN